MFLSKKILCLTLALLVTLFLSLIFTPPTLAREPFYLLFMAPNPSDLPLLKSTFGPDNSQVRIGFSSGFEYISSLGQHNLPASADWAIKPDYLNQLFDAAKTHNLPLMIHLNGHRWTTANFLSSIPETLMYTQEGKVLTELPEWRSTSYGYLGGGQVPTQQVGSLLFSLNEYNHLYRAYKKRNLQAAATLIAQFAKDNPTLFAGVSLDSEISFCPGGFMGWDNYKYSFDYNPMTIVQWRHWLSGTTGSYPAPNNPYALGAKWAGQGKNWTLETLKTRYQTDYANWDYVAPPHHMTLTREGISAALDNPQLVNDWLEFKATLTTNMLTDMVNWVEESGIPRAQIYTHQPSTIHGYPDLNRYCGIPYQSAHVPGAGVGMDLYGVDTHQSEFFASVQQLNPNWGSPEWNPTHLADPSFQTQAKLHTALKSIYDHGARYIVPNYFTTNSTFPGDPLQLYQHSAFVAAVKQLISDNATTKPGDLNGDGSVNLLDFNLLISKFGNPYTIYDFTQLVANFGK